MKAHEFKRAVDELYADTHAPDLLKLEQVNYNGLIAHISPYRPWPHGSFYPTNKGVEVAVSITPAFVLECLETEAGRERLRILARRYETAGAMYVYCVDQLSVPAAVSAI